MIVPNFPYDYGTEDDEASGWWEYQDRLRIFQLPELHPKTLAAAAAAADEVTQGIGGTTLGHDWDGDYVSIGDVHLGLCLDEYVTNGTCSNLTEFDLLPVVNNTSGTVDAVSAFSLWQVAVLGALAGCTSVVTVVGNLIVLLSFIIDRSIRQPTNYFIASLAVSDLFIGSLSMPFCATYLLAGKRWVLGRVLCDLWLSIDYTVCLSSIYTVFCITIDRFCSVIIPAKYRDWRTERKVLAMIGVTWVLPSLLFFVSIFGWQYFVGARTVPDSMCYVQYLENPVFNCLLQVGYFWITLIVICALYAGIYRVALKLARRSEVKHRKTATIVSMAGETVARIGVTVTQKHNPEQKPTTVESLDGAKESTRMAENYRPMNAVVLRSDDRIAGKTVEEEDRSSSVVFPSETDPGSSQSALSGHRRNGREATTSKPDAAIPKLRPPPSGKFCKDAAATPPKGDTVNGASRPAQHRGQTPVVAAAVGRSNPAAVPVPCRATGLPGSDECVVSSRRKGDEGGDDDDDDDDDDDAMNDRVRSFPNADAANRRKADSGNEAEVHQLNDLNERRSDRPSTTENSFSQKSPQPRQQRRQQQQQQQQRPSKRFALDCFRRHQDNAFRQNRRENHTRSSRSRSRDQRDRKTTKGPGGRRGPDKPPVSTKENRAKKALRTISVILGAFVICWTPWHVLTLVVGFYEVDAVGGLDTLYDISYWLCYLNSPINPFCYALANQQFKKTFARILKFDWHCT